MDINIIAVGKIKEKYINDGIKEFSKRLGSYCKLNIIEIPDRPAPENLSDKELENIIQAEGRDILNSIKRDSYIVSLVIGGKAFSSEELAQFIDDVGVKSLASNITFIIGGSNGLSREIINESDLKLSFSKMTFPHQLMRLILLEQIYRSFRIINNHPYHK